MAEGSRFPVDKPRSPGYNEASFTIKGQNTQRKGTCPGGTPWRKTRSSAPYTTSGTRASACWPRARPGTWSWGRPRRRPWCAPCRGTPPGGSAWGWCSWGSGPTWWPGSGSIGRAAGWRRAWPPAGRGSPCSSGSSSSPGRPIPGGTGWPWWWGWCCPSSSRRGRPWSSCWRCCSSSGSRERRGTWTRKRGMPGSGACPTGPMGASSWGCMPSRWPCCRRWGISSGPGWGWRPRNHARPGGTRGGRVRVWMGECPQRSFSSKAASRSRAREPSPSQS